MERRPEEIVDELERLIQNARPVPLTSQVRLESKQALKLIAELREALGYQRPL